MNNVGSAWKLPATGAVVLLLAAGVALVSVCLNLPALGFYPRWVPAPDLGWINSATPLILFTLLAWLAWVMFSELKAFSRRQQELAKFSLVANKTDAAVIITDANGLIEWVNDGFTRLSGFKAADVTGKAPAGLLLGNSPNARATVKFRDGFASAKQFTLEAMCAHKAGHRYWLSCAVTPVFNDGERPANFILLGTDITPRKRAEEEMARLNRRNELILYAAGEGICGLDVQGHITLVNPAAVRLTGWQPAELIGRPVSILLSQLRPPRSVNGAPQDLFTVAALRDGSVQVGEADIFKRKDASTFPVEMTSTPIHEGTNLMGAVVVFRDVTDRRNTEGLRTRQARQVALRAEIATALTTGETLESTLQRATIAVSKYLDGALARIWTLDGDEVTLTLTATAGPELEVDSTQRRIAVGDQTIGRIAKERVPHFSNDAINDAAPIERDWLKRERIACIAAFPLTVEDRLVGVVGVYSRKLLPDDTIELFGSVADSIAQGIVRRRAEQKVGEQAALLDKAQDAILVIDLANRVVYWNKSAERLYGWKAQDVIGRKLDELIYRDVAYFDRARKECLEKGEWRGESCQVNCGDEGVIVESQWTLVQDDAGKAKSILILNTDVSERRKLEAQFLRTQRMDSIGTLAGGIAHDLNNVLAPILMSVEMLKTKFKDEGSHRLLNILESSAKRGADMVKQVLTFARGVDGERVLLQTRHLIKELAKIAGDTFPKNIQLRTNVSDQLWTITGDATQLHQVLLNLAVNGRDAMPDGGVIQITAENCVLEEIPEQKNGQFNAKPGFFVLIKVADTGTGIPPEVLDKIFEPFFTTKELGKGTGLGLSTVLGIVKSHGGFVQVQTVVNKGTTFHVYLPASESNGQQQADTGPKTLLTGQGELIMVIDDESAVLTMTKETLEAFGYRVLPVKDSTDAVAAYSSQRNDIKLVLTDMVMPTMDGPAVIRVLKKLNPAVRVIAASGLMDSERVKDATGLASIAFLMKPYTAEKLLTMVHRVLHEEQAAA